MTDIAGSELPLVNTNTLVPATDVAFIIAGGITSIVRLRDLVNWSTYDAGNNISLGPDALAANETGINNICIGQNAGKSGVNASNMICIGHGAATDLALTDSLSKLEDLYLPAWVDYILYKAWSVDAEAAGSGQQALTHLQAFTAAFTSGKQVDMTHSSNQATV